MLPYDLVFTTHQTRRDPQARVLEAHLAGDLEGFSRWTIQEFPEGSRATFEEEVVANKKLLQRLDPVARPAFRANHKLMMKHGERGLRTYLAGYARAGTDAQLAPSRSRGGTAFVRTSRNGMPRSTAGSRGRPEHAVAGVVALDLVRTAGDRVAPALQHRLGARVTERIVGVPRDRRPCPQRSTPAVGRALRRRSRPRP